MKYKIIFLGEARRNLKKIKGKDKDKILVALKALESNPKIGEKMLGQYNDCYRLRVWPYRIVYAVENGKLLIFVIRIGQREGIYK